MYSSCNQQVEHVYSFVNNTQKKKHKIVYGGIDPQFNI
jgi:hypothetical protein